jgi:hypothetical protein
MDDLTKQLNKSNMRLIIQPDIHDNLVDICLHCDIEALVNGEWEYVKSVRANNLDELKMKLMKEFS